MAADPGLLAKIGRVYGRVAGRLVRVGPASAALAIAVAASHPAAATPTPRPTSPQADPPPPQAVQFPPALSPPYPDANDPVALGRWFGQTTHLPAKSILAITENAIFAAFPKHGLGPYWTVDVRVESITPQTTTRLGGRSIRLRLNVRCDDNRVRLSFLDVYPGADLTGAPSHRAPPNSWALPKPNSYVADAVRLACDKSFQGPLAAVAAGEPTPKDERLPAAGAGERGPKLRPSPPVAGVFVVQIGAYSTTAASQEAWKALQVAKPAITEGLSNATTPVRIGTRTLYRSVVQGFRTGADAAKFCQALQASGLSCMMQRPPKP